MKNKVRKYQKIVKYKKLHRLQIPPVLYFFLLFLIFFLSSFDSSSLSYWGEVGE